MAKRRRVGESLTGGTGDVNPQYMHGNVTESAADTTTTTSFQMPVARIPGAKDATVIELLKIFVDWPAFPGTGAAETEYAMGLQFSTVSFGATAATFDEPNVFAKFQRNRRTAFTAGGTYSVLLDDVQELDLTDGAGHGILIATDQIFGQAFSTATAVAQVYRWKMLYRFKRVGLLEYIGIVQSQQ